MKKTELTTPAVETKWKALAAELKVELSAMFGMPALKAGGKAIAGLFGNAVVFKLDGDAHAKALALKGAELFDPSGTGRPMKAWVVVPSAHAAKWSGLGKAALAAQRRAK